MESVAAALLVLCLSIAVVLVSVWRGHAPGEKRTHLFETEAGERANPFEGLSEGAADGPPTCHRCREELESEHYRYCTDCLPAD